MRTKIKCGIIAMGTLVISCQKIDIQEEITANSVQKKENIERKGKMEYGVSLKTASYLAKLVSKEEVKRVEDDGEYAPYASGFTGDEKNYQYLRKIYYNIRKK